MHKWYGFLFIVSVIALSTYSLCYSANTTKVAAVVHMANRAEAVGWAARNGANGVEMDLNFLPGGIPSEFKHGGPFCDCSFECANGSTCAPTNICRILWDITKSHCNASENPEKMMTAIGQNGDALAVVYIDSKLDNLGTASSNLIPAGQNVIKLLDKAFSNGFKGQVIINAPALKYSEYLNSAIQAAKLSPNNNNYFFTIDGEETKFADVMNQLIHSTPNRVYSTGISAALPDRYYTQIQLASMNLSHASIGGVGIWTLDNYDSMIDYLTLGANMILTNELPVLLSAIQAEKKELAKPGEAFFTATANDVTGYGAQECTHNWNCKNWACGRKTAADNAPLVCCPSGSLDMYWGYDYCAQMPNGSICWSDGMCASGYCRNNLGGTKKGICVGR